MAAPVKSTPSNRELSSLVDRLNVTTACLSDCLCRHLGGDSNVKHSQDEVPINVHSFRGAGVVIKVAKKPGMESVSLLAEDDESAESSKKQKKQPNLWNSLSK